MFLVYEYLNRVERPFGKCFLIFNSLDNSHQFVISDHIIIISDSIIFTEECDWIKNIILIILEEDCVGDIFQCMCFDN
jgi:hypothetical protein